MKKTILKIFAGMMSLVLTGCSSGSGYFVSGNVSGTEGSGSSAGSAEEVSNTFQPYSATASTPTPEVVHEKPQIIDYGYTIGNASGSYYIYYAVDVKNPDQLYAVKRVYLEVNIKASSGEILQSHDEWIASGIAAGDEYKYGTYIYYGDDEEPATVEISVRDAYDEDNNYILQKDSDFTYTSDYVISNVVESTEDEVYYETKGKLVNIEGDVTNNSNFDCDTLCVSVIYMRDGKMIGGHCGYLDNVKSGETSHFDIWDDFWDEKGYDSYEIYAYQLFN